MAKMVITDILLHPILHYSITPVCGHSRIVVEDKQIELDGTGVDTT
jgi:hypothetical protein